MSIISRFSCIVPSLTRQSYNDLELVQRTSSKLIPRIMSIVNLIEALMSKPWAITYSFKANTLLVTLLHLVED
jgi:Txe/YoeB family toxin of Txe-Axe toxin-antitoxin module